MLAYKFVKWDIPALKTLKDTREYILADKLERNITLTRHEKNELAKLALGNSGVIRLGGWLFPLVGLPAFYVEQYGHVYKVRAPDKTAVRAIVSGRIDRISKRE